MQKDNEIKIETHIDFKSEEFKVTIKNEALAIWKRHVREIDSQIMHKLSCSSYLSILLIKYDELLKHKEKIEGKSSNETTKNTLFG